MKSVTTESNTVQVLLQLLEQLNDALVAAFAVIHGVTINLPDFYDERDRFDFSGTNFRGADGIRPTL